MGKDSGIDRKNKDKGFAEVIAALIILAITVAASPALIQITKHVSSEIAKANQPSSAYVSVSNGIVSATNPMPVSISLDRIQLTVNGEPVPIQDANHNGVWEPFEKITFDLNSMLKKDVAVVTLYIDGAEVYRAIYTRPTAFPSDTQYPVISIDASAGGNKGLSLNISIDDDVAVALQEVRIGDVSGERLHSQTDFLEEYVKGGKSGKGKDKGKDSEHSVGLEKKIAALIEDLRNMVESGNKDSIPDDLKHVYSEVTINQNLSADQYIRVVAKDITGKTSSKIIWLRELAPEVHIIRPADGQTFWNNEDISILARAIGADRVYLYIDGSLILSENAESSPYDFGKKVRLDVGTHTIKARAVNNVGAGEDSVTITVIPDNPPTVRIIQPADGSTFVITSNSYTLTVKATASDDRGVREVRFYDNGRYLGADTAAPYQITATLGLGTHTIKAVAVDTAGQTASDTVTVSVVRDNPPTVKITSPHNGQTFTTTGNSYSLTVRATASDDRGVREVRFYDNDRFIGSDSSAPYEITATFGLGTHTIKAVAVDTAGQTASDTVTITVEKVGQPPKIVQASVPAIGWSTDFSRGAPFVGGGS